MNAGNRLSTTLTHRPSERPVRHRHLKMSEAKVAELPATENVKNMLLRRKYCSNDDTNPNVNPKLPGGPKMARAVVSKRTIAGSCSVI